MGSTRVEAPAPLDPAKVGAESLRTQIELAPQQYAAEAQFAPQYASLYANIMRNTLLGQGGQGGLLDTYSLAAPKIGDLQAQLNAQQRAADIADVQRYGQEAVAAFKAANPELAALQGGFVSQLTGPNSIWGTLSDQARAQLAAGGELTPYQQSQIANQVASQANLYGRQADPITAATMALNLDQARMQRLQQAQNFAAQVAQGQEGAYINAANQLAATNVDPFQAILGRSGGLQQTAGLTGQAQGMPTSGQGFNPFDQSILGIYQGNAANQLAAQTAQANASAAKTAGIFQGIGSLAGGIGGGIIAKGCWVAREVYGPTNPEWLKFRSWLFNFAPTWFFNLYIKHGERFASFISNKPILKKMIRKWMDSRIATLKHY